MPQVQDSRTGAVLNIDPRSGAVSGSRADQSNVTLDGIDVNDPQFGTAYTSALRMTLDSLQEFRVSTSNYGADSGRSQRRAGVARHQERHQRLPRRRPTGCSATRGSRRTTTS